MFAPFGVAFAAAAMSERSVCREYGYAPAAGAVVGYVLTAGTLSNMKYLAAMALMLALRAFLCVSPRLKASVALPCAVAASGISAAGIAFALMMRSGLYDVISSLCEGCVSGGTAFFFLRAMMKEGENAADKPRAAAITETQRRICLVISFSALLLGLYV